MTRVSVFTVTAIVFSCFLWASHFFIRPDPGPWPWWPTYLILTLVGVGVISSLLFPLGSAGFGREKPERREFFSSSKKGHYNIRILPSGETVVAMQGEKRSFAKAEDALHHFLMRMSCGDVSEDLRDIVQDLKTQVR